MPNDGWMGGDKGGANGLDKECVSASDSSSDRSSTPRTLGGDELPSAQSLLITDSGRGSSPTMDNITEISSPPPAGPASAEITDINAATSSASSNLHSPTGSASSEKCEKISPGSPTSPKETVDERLTLSQLLSSHGANMNVLASSLLGNSIDSSSSQINSLMQSLPLLSSVLPALQRLNTGSMGSPSLASLSSLCNSSSGLVCVCGVKFTSKANLEAHRLFYCSQRQGILNQNFEEKDASSSLEIEENDISPKAILRCPHCSYTTTHKLSLNGHMNMHTNPEASQQTQSLSKCQNQGDSKAKEKYCSECDIQFSSLKTYRVHKTHYCQTRHVLKGSKSPPNRDENSSSSPGSSAGIANQPVLALPTNPVLLLPYSMVAGAQILPPHILPQLGAAFVLPNGQVQPIPSASSNSQTLNGNHNSVPPLLSPSSMAAAAAALLSSGSSRNIDLEHHNFSSELLDESKSQILESSVKSSKFSNDSTISRKRTGRESPLDLTTKRPKLYIKTDLLSDEEKENRLLNSVGTSGVKGETERKTLISPSFDSSSNHSSGDKDDVKSSRCSSTTPKGGSPRRNVESPIKSSINTIFNSRSPGHVSPGSSTSNLQVPLGFPNSLLNNLESLGSTFPLSSLQCLQSLQNMPPDIAMKLINPDLLMNGVPTVLPPPVIVKQGEAKCEECNIVFYKEVNLQIHKQHYCSARESKLSDSEKVKSPNSANPESSSTRQNKENQSDSNTNSSPREILPKSMKPLLQFICTACGIKFSSPDNLNAHQTYYCPKREISSDERTSKSLWRCPRCKISMAETLQATHQCVTPSPSSTPGWKCPCCSLMSPTAAAAQKHLETHAGIKAFRCRICGYRGNTLRGMRTHIRMHFEKRTNDLQEENFIACILEEDDQRPRGINSTPESHTRQLLDSTRAMLEKSVISMFLDEPAVADQDNESNSIKCACCPFVTSSKTLLLQHMALTHKQGLEAVLNQELKNIFQSQTTSKEPSNSSNVSHEESRENNAENDKIYRDSESQMLPIKLEPEVKLEIQEEKNDGIEFESVNCPLPNGINMSEPMHCHVCNIDFSQRDSYIAHKRLYCSRPSSRTPPETTVQ